MDVSQVIRNRLVSNNQDAGLTLKKGSILRGTILKLYPQNRAQIQLGSQTLIAQLEAPLQLGGKYHFQVQSVDDTPRLKVFGEQLNNQSTHNSDTLLQLLNLKSTKTNTHFLQQIVNKNIPFSKEQLTQAFTLIEEAPNKQQAAKILEIMFVKRLPMTHHVFQALYATHTTSLSNQLQGLSEQLNSQITRTGLQQQLMNMVVQLTSETAPISQPVVREIMTEAHNNNYRIFNLFKAADIIDSDLNFSTWKTFWIENEGSTRVTLNPPFRFDQVMAHQVMKTGPEIAKELQQAAQSFTKNWSQHMISTDGKLTNNDFEQFKHGIQTRLLPLLSYDVRQQLIKLLDNEPQQLRQIMTFVETLTSSRTNILVTNARISDLTNLPLIDPKHSFLVQVNNVQTILGLSYEHTLAEDMGQQEATMKSMLIQMLSQTEGSHSERGQQLLHFINGLQLESIQETTNFIQANLHIPGGKLGLNEDLFLEFESKKTDDGKINPDYCRIIFYLDLAYLEQTVIDMHVHNRLVSLTVYTKEQTGIEQLMHTLQPVLKSGLLELDYQLTSVALKPFVKDSHRQHGHKNIQSVLQETYEGIDFRI